MDLTLIFTLGEERYGLEIDAIQEVIEDSALYAVPLAEGALNGAINFHGQILAVIDLPDLLGFSGEQRDHRHIVLTPEFKSMVFSVSGVERIVRLDLSSLQPAPAVRFVVWSTLMKRWSTCSISLKSLTNWKTDMQIRRCLWPCV